MFVFFQVGNTIFASIMVRSILACNPGATIIQCSDHDTPDVEGVSEVRRHSLDGYKMLCRTEHFARLALDEPAIFLDTDMIVNKTVDLRSVVGAHDVAVCKRSYNLNMKVRPRGYGVEVDLPEYRDRTYGDVYPYLGCVTVTNGRGFWVDCYKRYLDLPKKFWGWFGDQEIIRDAVRSGDYKVKELPESRYACLVDVEPDPDPVIVHFKGKNRKPMMLDAAERLGLLTEREKCLT